MKAKVGIGVTYLKTDGKRNTLVKLYRMVKWATLNPFQTRGGVKVTPAKQTRKIKQKIEYCGVTNLPTGGADL